MGQHGLPGPVRTVASTLTEVGATGGSAQWKDVT